MINELFSLAGRVAVVTGGSKGLGLEMGRVLAAAGARVVITSRNFEEVTAAAAELAADAGGEVVGIEADAGDERQVDQMISDTISRFGRLDILVNNAGINRHGELDEIVVADWEHVLQVDLTGPMLCARAAVPFMKQQSYGRIINISSIFGLTGYVRRSAYCASKGALINLTRCWAVELAAQGVTVNAICPGPFDTPMTAALVQGPARDEFTARIPMGRWGRPAELAAAVLYFASPASAFTTGAVLAVDGGWTAI